MRFRGVLLLSLLLAAAGPASAGGQSNDNATGPLNQEVPPAATVCAAIATLRPALRNPVPPAAAPPASEYPAVSGAAVASACNPAPPVGAAVVAAAPVAAADGCHFVLGFAALYDQIPKLVGQCIEAETYNPANGDALQHTTGGLLVWRKADNWTAFTDGYHTWINGPSGVQERLNSQRFPWESDLNTPRDAGYLEGRVTIGPLRPVETGATPAPPPEVCTARGLTIYQADGTTQVTTFNLQPDCTYRVALSPGSYVVQLAARGLEMSKGLPATVVVASGQTVRLDVSIDTGIR